MRTWRGLSLFSGIGGLDLAFEWAGGGRQRVSAMCEIEPYCQKVLRKHWPNVLLFEDIRELRGSDVGAVDVVYGGPYCASVSPSAWQETREGKTIHTIYGRAGQKFSRVVSEVRPRWIVAENARQKPGILRLAADDVCSDLERQGYAVGIWDFEAASVGAKHRRERVFFVAHTRCPLRQGSFEQGTLQNETGEGTSYQLERSGSPPSPDTDKIRCNLRGFEGQRVERQESAFYQADTGCEAPAYPSSERCEEQRESVKVQPAHVIFGCCGRWESEPGICRMAHGIPYRVDRLRALGNAVVPQQAYSIFKAIMEADSFAS